MRDFIARADKVMARVRELAAISEDGSCITRRFGTAAALEAGQKVMEWMLGAGLKVRVDNIGNIRGRWEAAGPGAKTLVIGSHVDTVVDAGQWDGPLGVLMGLDLLEELIAEGVELPFNIELIAFSDEEGVRFHTTYLGSKVVTGSFEPALLERRDGDGVSLSEVIKEMGGNIGRLSGDAIAAEEWLGYFEIHIEQGPVLYERDIPVAVVSAIAGQVRAEVVIEGVAGHAGTVPMDLRRDALAGAAEFILEVERVAGSKGLVATVGKLEVVNAASNVIPGKVICSVDVRSADGVVLSRGCEQLRLGVESIGWRRGLAVGWRVVQESSPVACDGGMGLLLGRCIAAAGYEVVELVSGAGHDAVPVSAVSPVCMLFVRCYKGISHNPQESVEKRDLVAAVEVADRFLHQLSEIWKYPR